MKSDATDASGERALGDLADYYNSAQPMATLTPVARARVKQRVRQTLAQHRPSLARWQLAITVLCATVAGGLVWAAVVPLRGVFGPQSPPTPQPENRPAVVRRLPRSAALARSPVETPASTAKAEPVAPAPPARRTTAPTAVRRHATVSVKAALPSAPLPGPPEPLAPASSAPAAMAVAAPSPAPRAPESPGTQTGPAWSRASPIRPAPAFAASVDGGEALLAEALRRLRGDRDPAAALRALEAHAVAHSQGALAEERDVLRVEALLALGRSQEALALLDTRALEATPRSAERFLLRAELRARFRRSHEAIADFTRVLELAGPASSSELAERALWGRAASRLSVGDRAGAQEDLSIYQARFPRGRFAVEVARLRSQAR